MLAVRDHLTELGPDTTVAVVTFASGPRLADYVAHHELPFAVLGDPEREAYRSYGLARGARRRVWGLRAGARYLEIIRRDGLGRLRRPVDDPLQLGGDFVIAPDGTLAWGFWGEGPDDRPPVATLIAEVSRLRR